MDFGVLGALRVANGAGVLDIPGAKERTLLAHLLAAGGSLVPAGDLIDSLWGQAPPRTAAKSLQTYVLRLRNVLEPERQGLPTLLLTEGPGYRLAVRPDDVDAGRFARLVALGRRAAEEGRAESAAATLADALTLWRGPAYAGFEETGFGRAEGRRLEELRLSATEERWSAELDSGRAVAVVPELERLIEQHPLRERLWSLLVLSLYRSGRQADALGAYERARGVLAEELGIDPGPELRALHARVLAQDPTLAGPAPRAVVPAALVAPSAPLVGRRRELALLRAAWERAVVGQTVTVALRGPAGAGATRLAAALAQEVAHSGGAVVHVDADSGPIPLGDVGPLLVVADHAAPPVLERAGLVLALVGSSGSAPAGAEIVDLPPLSPGELRELVATCLPAGDVDDVLPEVLAASGGWPGPALEAAGRCARRRAASRIGVAATQADRSHAELVAARADLADGVAALAESPPAEPVEHAGCPWRGLQSYDVEDAPWFAGRERLVAQLVSRVAGTRLLGVVGPSGSGKSSAVRAGLLAALADDVLPGSATWTQVVLRPGDHPMRALAHAALGSSHGSVDDLLGRLIRSQEDRPAGRALVVVDQLEEVWTSCSDAGERAAFLDTLVELVQDRQSALTVVLVVRADWVGSLADHAPLATALADATVLVGSPTPEEVRRAIERPAARAGLRLDVGLADALVSDAGAEPGLLPLLSSALAQLWEARSGRDLTFSAYVGMGGLSGSIAHLAEQAYHRLDDDDRTAARLLLLRLTGPGEGAAVTRRRVPLSEVTSLPHPGVPRVVDALASARLLTVSQDAVEVAHEALFREWPRLRNWLAEDLDGRAVQRRLAVAASEWAAEQHDPVLLWRGARLASALEAAESRPDEITPTERAFLDAAAAEVVAQQHAAEERAAATVRQNRRLRRLLSGTALLLVVAVTAGSLAVRARSSAAQASVSADARRLAATALNVEAPDLALLTAVEATQAEQSAETYGALLTLLARQPEVVTRLRSPDRFLNVGVSRDGRTVFLGENRSRFRAVDAESGDVLWDLPTPGDGQPGPLVGLADGSGVFTSVLAAEPMMAAFDGRTGEQRWSIGTEQLHAVAGTEANPFVWSGGQRADGRLVFATDSHVFMADQTSGRVLDAVAWPYPTPFTPHLLVWPDGRVSRDVPDDPSKGLVFDPARPADGFREVAGVPLALSPDGRRVVVASESGGIAQIRVLDSVTFAPSTPWQHVGAHLPRSGAWSADGAQLLVTADETVQLRDGRTAALQREMRPHAGEVMGAVYAGPERDLVWTGSRDGTATALDLSGTRTVVRQVPMSARPYTGAVAADTALAVAFSYPREPEQSPLRLLDPRTGADRGTLALADVECHCEVAAVAMEPDGTHALAALVEFDEQRTTPVRERGHLAVWRTSDRRLERVVELPWSPYALAVAPDGGTAVVAGRSGYAFVDLSSYEVVGEPVPQDEMEWLEGLRDVKVSPDGRWAAMARNHEVVVVDMATRAVARRTSSGPEKAGVQALAWSPDSRALAVSTEAGWLSFLDAADLRPLAPRRLIADGWVLDLAFRPDGQMLASLGGGGDLMLWDTRTWKPYGEPVTDNRTYGFLDFRDEDAVRVLFQDGVLTEVATRPAQWREAACRAANRELTGDEWAVVRPGGNRGSACGHTA